MPPEENVELMTKMKTNATTNGENIREQQQLDDYNSVSVVSSEEQGDASLVDNTTLPRREQAMFATPGTLPIVLVALLVAMSFGSTVGIIPKIMTQRFAEITYGYDSSGEEENCNSFVEDKKPQACIDGNRNAQDAASISEAASSTMTLLTSALIGSISDVHGRRHMFILGVLMATFGPFALLYVHTNPTASPWIYYLGRALHGLVNHMAIALTAVADLVPPRQRAAGVGLVMAGFWFGLCVAPMIAIFADHYHVILISCALQLAAIVITMIFFPETLSQNASDHARRRVDGIMGGNNVSPHAHNNNRRRCGGRNQALFFSFISRPIQELSILNRNGFFRLLSALAFFNGMVIQGDKTLLLYYVDTKLSFTTKDVAIMFLLVGFTAVVTQSLLLKPLNDRIGERMIVIVCFFTSIVSNFIYGIAWNRNVLYAGICLGGLAQMAFPTISAIKANNVDNSEQGRIQGALYSIQAIASGFGPMMMRLVDHLAKDTSTLGPGTMFIFNAFVQLVAFVLSCRLPKDKSNSSAGNSSPSYSIIEVVNDAGREMD